MEWAIRTKAVTKSYGGHCAVNQVNLNVRRGEIYGLVGRNGAGKTTLMRLIAGIIEPTHGRIELFGEETAQNRRRMGVLIESPAFYPHMTALENLEVHRRMLGIVEQGSLVEVLKTVGLENAGRKAVRQFSLGMKQRLGIALALLGNPDLLMLDEPVNGLDVEGVKEIRELILKLSKEKGITVLISSHLLEELSKLADVYGIMHDGVLVEEITAEKLERKSNQCLLIQVDDVVKAGSVLEQVLKTENYEVMTDRTIALYDLLEVPGAVNRHLVMNGVEVQKLMVTGQSLESYFVEVTERL